MYYLNPGWDSKSNGGQLRLYSRSGKQVGGWVGGLGVCVCGVERWWVPTHLPHTYPSIHPLMLID